MTVASTAVLLQLAPVVCDEVDAVASREVRPVGLLVADAVRRGLSDAVPVIPRRADETARTGRSIELDSVVLGEAAAFAARHGCTVDQVVEDSVRRDLAVRLLEPRLAQSGQKGPQLSEAEALELAYRELDAFRDQSDVTRR